MGGGKSLMGSEADLHMTDVVTAMFNKALAFPTDQYGRWTPYVTNRLSGQGMGAQKAFINSEL